MANFNQTLTMPGLHTLTVNIPTTDQYNFVGTLTLPTAPGSATQGPGGGANTGTGAPPLTPSQVVCTVNQNGSPIFTTNAGATGFALNAVNCTAGDVFTFVLTSSLPSDAANTNTIRLTLAVSEGPI
jgi:hypothetical protein